jgi:hypothetical protein
MSEQTNPIEHLENTEKDYEAALEAVQKAERELEEQKEKLKIAKTQTIEYKKGHASLPPGFKIKWWSRQDPFEGEWALYLHDEQIWTHNDHKGDDFAKAALYDIAVRWWGVACQVFKKDSYFSGRVKDDED